jgi:LysM repeat protein
MVGKSARFLAPIALAAVAVGIYLIVHSTLAKHEVTGTRTGATVIHSGTTHHTARRRSPKFYVVRNGDTLSQISARTRVGVAQLMTLNPALAQSPNSLQPGQHLRLRH